MKRTEISPATIAAVAAENAGHAIDGARAVAHAEALEPILQLIDGLRSVPLADVEPALVFRPVARDAHD